MCARLVSLCLTSLYLVSVASCTQVEAREAASTRDSHNANANTNIAEDLGPDRAAALVDELYSLISPDPVNIINIIPQGTFYRVSFEVLASKRVEQSVFVSRDGKYLSESITDISVKTKMLQSEKSLLECLSKKGVRVFLKGNDQNNIAQITALGRFHSLITIDCGVAPGICSRHQVTSFPTILDGDALVEGPKPLAWFEALTLCK